MTEAQVWHLDVLGSVAFTPVKSDMQGNIKVYTHCNEQLYSASTDADVRRFRKSVTVN